MSNQYPSENQRRQQEAVAERELRRDLAQGASPQEAAEHVEQELERNQPDGAGIDPATPAQGRWLIALSVIAAVVILAVALSLVFGPVIGLVSAVLGIPFVILGTWPLWTDVALRDREVDSARESVRKAEARQTPPTRTP